ncbi:hypothetical protein Gohar_017559 [Gossypium harknessii]|uniref:Uncharacterized protein n=1 Tax=Gossypium harknessii TaxID=34285 RepID=A0A7J9G6C7_9ROSI|nr:hypothetical protein [Gossypium harknessii]
MDAEKKAWFWLDRTLLLCLLYFAVDGNKQHFIATLVALILHDFVVYMGKLLLQDIYALFSTLLHNLKLRSLNKSGTIEGGNYNSMREKEEVEIRTTVKKNEKEGEEGSMQVQVACESCRMLKEKEAMKAKGKYKDKYKKKLLQKEENFDRVKSTMKEKYNEDRDKWEEERKLLKIKYEEMRWT